MNRCGTLAAYVAGCRCEQCSTANREYQRKYRRNNPKARAANIRNAKRRNHAAMLALRYLKQNNPQAYFAVLDEADAWIQAGSN